MTLTAHKKFGIIKTTKQEIVMPNWGELLQRINNGNPLDVERRKYLRILNKYTGRNVIAYYSGFLQKPGIAASQINDNDKNGFMQAICGLDKSKGLDLILHTPGGEIAATESIVCYLKSIFGNNIRAIVPQIAMSAGTMIALSCKEIIMGKQSNIGAIDPQFNGISCDAVLEEFEQACLDIKVDPSKIPLWQVIIGKYHPTFLGDCKKARDWAAQMVETWLKENMLLKSQKKDEIAYQIIDNLAKHSATKTHSRHIHIKECKKIGIKVLPLEDIMKDTQIEDCKDFQDCVLTVHHAYMHTFSNSAAIKIIENHNGSAIINNSFAK